MPTPGLSLVGFLTDQQHALFHLKVSCVPDPANKPDAALIADWQAATAKLGRRIMKAGNPTLIPIPMADPHIQQLMQVPWAPAIAALIQQGATFQMVEIDPLLAYQFSVDRSRSANRCKVSQPPTRDELLQVCLPLTLSSDQAQVSRIGQAIVIKSRSLNLRMIAEGPIQMPPNSPDTIGVQVAWTLPLVHVVRFNGRCYLHNGYHRACGLRRAGATEMPCIFRNVADAVSVGIQPPGTFDLQLLESANPPTMAHFRRRAMKVALRATSRVIQINWSEHTMTDE